MDHAGKLKFSSSSAIYTQNVSVSLCLIDSLQCRRGSYFRAWVLYFNFGICLSNYVLLACINAIYKYGSRLGDLVRCISFNFWAQKFYIWDLKIY